MRVRNQPIRHRRAATETLEPRIAMAGDIAGVFGESAALVADINLEPDEMEIRSAAQLDDNLHLLVHRESGNIDLWQTDGTTEPTQSAQISAGATRFFTFGSPFVESPHTSTALANVGGKLYFTFTRVEREYSWGEKYGYHELWATQGTAETTRRFASDLGLVSDQGEGTTFVDVEFYDDDGKILMTVFSGGCGVNSCRGNESFWTGDERVASYSPHYGYSSDFLGASGAEGIVTPTQWGDDWYFLGPNENDRGFALFRTNPATKHTVKVQSLFDDGNSRGTLKLIDGSLYIELRYYVVEDETDKTDLWKSDGTTDGTLKLPEDHPSQALLPIGRTPAPDRGAIPSNVYVTEGMRVGNLLIVPTYNELWVTDGTDEGTKNLGMSLRLIGEFNEEAIVADGNDLFVIDPDDLGLRPIGSVTNEKTLGIDVWTLAARPSGVFFVNSDNYDLRSINPESGQGGVVLENADFATNRIATIDSDPHTIFVFGPNGFGAVDARDNSFRIIHRGDWSWTEATSLGDRLYITVARQGTNAVWVSDGTSEGTSMIAGGLSTSSYPSPIDPVYVEEKIFLGIESKLWVTSLDGTQQDLGVSQVHSMVGLGGELYFLRNIIDSSSQNRHVELWKSNGSFKGTQRVIELPTDADDLFLAPTELVAMNGSLFFGDGEGRLYGSDGTADGTQVLRSFPQVRHDLQYGPYPSQIDNLIVAGDQVLFTVDDGVHGNELWVTDGTAEGTQLAADIGPGGFGSQPSGLAFSNDQLFFIADDGERGREFWQIDLSETALPGDADANGQVNFADFLILSTNFGSQTDRGGADGDFDENGQVDLADFALLSQNFGRSL